MFQCSDDEIRQNEGFQNISLGNALSAAYKDKRVSSLAKTDKVTQAPVISWILSFPQYISTIRNYASIIFLSISTHS